MKCGTCYIAYGNKAMVEVVASVETLRHVHPDMRVTVIGTVLPQLRVALVPFSRRGYGGRWAKVNLDLLTPYDHTLYIDADTRVRLPLTAGFEILADGWDVVITPSANQGDDVFWHLSDDERVTTLEEVTEPLQLQGGVFWFAKNDRTKVLFENWRHEWLRWQHEDQGALIRAIKRSPARVWLVGRPFNGGAVVEHRFGACRK